MKVTVGEALEKAVGAHSLGRFEDAERIYRAILRAKPKHFEVLYNYGILLFELHEYEKSLNCFLSASHVVQGSADCLCNIGVVQHKLKK